MELKDFVSKCLAQINEAINENDNFELDDEINFDVPLSPKSDYLEIPVGDSAKAAGLPRIFFSVELAKKDKTKKDKPKKEKK